MPLPHSVTLLSNAAADSALAQWPGGKTAFIAEATFGGGTVKLQRLGLDGSTEVDVSGASLTANGMAVVDLPPGQYKADVTTATAVYAALVRVPS